MNRLALGLQLLDCPRHFLDLLLQTLNLLREGSDQLNSISNRAPSFFRDTLCFFLRRHWLKRRNGCFICSGSSRRLCKRDYFDQPPLLRRLQILKSSLTSAPSKANALPPGLFPWPLFSTQDAHTSYLLEQKSRHSALVTFAFSLLPPFMVLAPVLFLVL